MSSRNYRRKHQESDSEDSSESEETIGTYDTEDWETDDSEESSSEESGSEEVDEDSDEESEESSDSSYVPKKKRKSKDQDKIEKKEIQKIISKMFPSKYMKEKVRKSDRLERKSKNDKKIKKKSKSSKKKREYKSESDEEYEEYMRNAEEDDEEDGKINIIFGFGGAEEDDEAELEEDENEECDSDDEQTFMKEDYQKLELPEETKQEEDAKKQNKKQKKKSSKNKTKDSEDSDSQPNVTFESEYKDLVDMKKYFTEKLHEKPKSKTLLKSLNECKDSIKKLVKKARNKNTKNYHKLINSHKQKMTNEMDYFKKNLSNKEQMKIMGDLKIVNEQIQVVKPYRLSLLESLIPNKYKGAVMQKLNLLKSMESTDSEYYKIKNWVDAFMKIPFGKYKNLEVKMENGIEECTKFMDSAIADLDTCVYGLNDAKMQILQMIGQWISNPSALGTAIAVKGPPGTGKTSLIKDGISKILGRDFSFIALGGASDSSFLEGHSYTYEGSMWGKIVQILMESKSMNPVIYFDELDKVSDTPKGEEIIGILTHLTDTSQNSSFHDKFFPDIEFDLSKCLFIFSYNDESKINPILKDRMYHIQTKGYNTKEKVIIANKYLLPKIREQVNFSDDDVVIPDETLEYIITKEGFTKREEGVRNLKRCLEIIHTKLNLYRLVKPDNTIVSKEIKLDVKFPFTVKKSDVDVLIKCEEGVSQSMLALYV